MASCGSADPQVAADPISVSAAESPAASAGVGQRIRNQDLLDQAVADIDQRADGFAALRYDVAKLSVDIVWKGEPPEAVRKLEGTNEDGVKLTLVRVPLGQSDMIVAMGRINALQDKGELPRTVTMYPNQEYRGIVVGFLSSEYEGMNNEAMLQKFRNASQVPVEFVVASPPQDM